MDTTKIVIKNVSKSYGKIKALDQVSLTINEGMFGLLGNNGAGKSTLISLMATLENPDSGDITINGYSTTKEKNEVRGLIGYLPQDFSIYPQLTAYEFIDHILMLNHYKSAVKRKAIIDDVLEKVNLAQERNQKVRGFSGGMLRRLGIAQAIAKDPKILIVDEPTAGLDPEERIRFRTLLFELSQHKAVILSTHIVEDISASCEQMSFLNKGQLKYVGEPIDFISKVDGYVFEVHISNRDELLTLKRDYTIISMKQTQKGTVVRLLLSTKIAPSPQMNKVDPSLEDAYLFYLKQVREEEETSVSNLGNH